MTQFTEYMQEYLDDFKNRDKNDPLFIKDFTEWLATLGHESFQFEGDNDYCGFTVAVYKEDSRYSWDTSNTAFEVSYRGTEPYKIVKVYTPYHNSFWVPEYIDLAGEDCTEILGVIKSNLNKWGGF